MIAEKEEKRDRWIFYEKSSWDILWVKVPPTTSLLMRADSEHK
jgi:hypothetical protein